jgi:hypothetical protein
VHAPGDALAGVLDVVQREEVGRSGHRAADPTRSVPAALAAADEQEHGDGRQHDHPEIDPRSHAS